MKVNETEKERIAGWRHEKPEGIEPPGRRERSVQLTFHLGEHCGVRVLPAGNGANFANCGAALVMKGAAGPVE